MSEVRTLQVEKYRDATIYYRQIGPLFEYLAVIFGEVYTMHIIVKQPLLRRLAGLDYTAQHLTDAVKFLKQYAESTVDFKLDEQSGKK